MAVRRRILAVLLALYAAQNALGAVYSTSLKFGWVRATAEMQRLVPLTQSTTVLQLAAWWISIVLFFAAALRLVQRKPAFGYYAVAFLLSLGKWIAYKLGGVYDETFTPAELNFDYVLLAVTVLFGAAIWLIEGGAGRKAKSNR